MQWHADTLRGSLDLGTSVENEWVLQRQDAVRLIVPEEDDMVFDSVRCCLRLRLRLKMWIDVRKGKLNGLREALC